MKRIALALLCALGSSSAMAAYGGTVNQGAAAGAATAWPVFLTIGGSAISTSNSVWVQPGTGVTWAVTQSGTWTVSDSISATATNTASSTLTRPANTTAYSAGQLIANSTTAGSVTPISFTIANSAGGVAVQAFRLRTNAATGWGTTLLMNVWTAAATYTNGDGGTYAVSTGSSNYVGQWTCVLTQFADGAAGRCAINSGTYAVIKLGSGTTFYGDLQTTAGVTPISGQTFVITPELLN